MWNCVKESCHFRNWIPYPVAINFLSLNLKYVQILCKYSIMFSSQLYKYGSYIGGGENFGRILQILISLIKDTTATTIFIVVTHYSFVIVLIAVPSLGRVCIHLTLH